MTLYLTIMKIVHCPFKTRPCSTARESVLCQWTKWNICWSSDEELIGFFADGTWTEKRRHASTRKKLSRVYFHPLVHSRHAPAEKKSPRFFFSHNNEILNALFCLCHKIFFFSYPKSVKKKKSVFFLRARLLCRSHCGTLHSFELCFA